MWTGRPRQCFNCSKISFLTAVLPQRRYDLHAQARIKRVYTPRNLVLMPLGCTVTGQQTSYTCCGDVIVGTPTGLRRSALAAAAAERASAGCGPSQQDPAAQGGSGAPARSRRPPRMGARASRDARSAARAPARCHAGQRTAALRP